MEIIISILSILLDICLLMGVSILTSVINIDLPPYIFFALIIVFIIVNY